MISVADLRRAAQAAKENAAREYAAAAAAATFVAAAATTQNQQYATPEPALQGATCAQKRSKVGHRIVTFRHDPYSYRPIVSKVNIGAERSFNECYESYTSTTEAKACAKDAASSSSSANCVAPSAPVAMSSAGFALPIPASRSRHSTSHPQASSEADTRRGSKSVRDVMELSSNNDDGVSEVSSEVCGAYAAVAAPKALKQRGHSSMVTPAQDPLFTPEAEQAGLSPESTIPNSFGISAAASSAPAAPPRLPSVIRYASVNFRFGSAWFIAPFRTAVGDLVVVEYPANNSLHMGLVAAVTTTKPDTFYSAENPNPDTLTEDEVAVLPRLLRHARDFDKDTKLDLRTHDLRSLQAAQQLAKDMGVPMRFLDAEWLLDLSAITFLVSVHGGTEDVINQLADELASMEGAEVVFTYPTVKHEMLY